MNNSSYEQALSDQTGPEDSPSVRSQSDHRSSATAESLTPRPLSDDSAITLAETFKLLGDATRVRILDALSRSELCVRDLARAVGLTESAVSHQLRLLRGMRVVRARRAGKLMFYALDDLHIFGLFKQGLAHVEEHALGTGERGSR